MVVSRSPQRPVQKLPTSQGRRKSEVKAVGKVKGKMESEECFFPSPSY
jgi:hypothetical protein